MKVVYTSENRFIVSNVKNILCQSDIDVILKNEYAAGAVGDLSAFDAWMEVWVLNDRDHSRACEIVADLLSNKDSIEWECLRCKERNDDSFDFCWNCHDEKPHSAPL